jgi:hypothetical protein
MSHDLSGAQALPADAGDDETGSHHGERVHDAQPVDDRTVTSEETVSKRF